jgi:hypothetical protein
MVVQRDQLCLQQTSFGGCWAPSHWEKSRHAAMAHIRQVGDALYWRDARFLRIRRIPSDSCSESALRSVRNGLQSTTTVTSIYERHAPSACRSACGRFAPEMTILCKLDPDYHLGLLVINITPPSKSCTIPLPLCPTSFSLASTHHRPDDQQGALADTIEHCQLVSEELL